MKSLKRRDFLKSVVAASAVGVVHFNILKAGPSPNSKLNIAGIGIGSQGSGNLSYLTRSNNVIALCDVDQERFGKCIADKKELQGIKLWNDYRVMFDKIGKDIDAVCIATPEHNHYTISMHAIRNGKHVYCQKPLCHTVNEVRGAAFDRGGEKVSEGDYADGASGSFVAEFCDAEGLGTS